MSKTNSHRHLSSAQREFILSNGASAKEIPRLFCQEFGTEISELAVHRLLQGHLSGNGNGRGFKPRCKRRNSHSVTGALSR